MNLNKLLQKIKHRKKVYDYKKVVNNSKIISLKKDNSSRNDVFSLPQKKLEEIERASNIWYNNVRSMSAITKARNSRYFVFLQPTYGLDMQNESFASLSDAREIEAGIQLTRKNYLLRINTLYVKLREKCSTLKYCIDLSQDKELNQTYNYYSDPRHLNKEGNKILSSKILRELISKLDIEN